MPFMRSAHKTTFTISLNRTKKKKKKINSLSNKLDQNIQDLLQCHFEILNIKRMKLSREEKELTGIEGI